MCQAIFAATQDQQSMVKPQQTELCLAHSHKDAGFVDLVMFMHVATQDTSKSDVMMPTASWPAPPLFVCIIMRPWAVQPERRSTVGPQTVEHVLPARMGVRERGEATLSTAAKAYLQRCSD